MRVIESDVLSSLPYPMLRKLLDRVRTRILEDNQLEQRITWIELADLLTNIENIAKEMNLREYHTILKWKGDFND